MAAMSDLASVSQGMPCCPDQKPCPPDCLKSSCPLAVACVAKCFPGAPAVAAFVPARFATADTIPPGDDVWRDLLPEPPPPKPPKA